MFSCTPAHILSIWCLLKCRSAGCLMLYVYLRVASTDYSSIRNSHDRNCHNITALPISYVCCSPVSAGALCNLRSDWKDVIQDGGVIPYHVTGRLLNRYFFRPYDASCPQPTPVALFSKIAESQEFAN